MTYGGWMALAALASVLWAVFAAGAGQSNRWHALRIALNAHAVCAVLAAVAGRAVFVAINQAYFSEHSAELLDLAGTPGFSAQGALAGHVIALWLLRRRPDWRAAVALAPLLAGLAASLGCVSAGCGAGREVFWTDGPLWALRVDWPDAVLARAPRLPAQGFMIAWLLCGLAVLRTRRLAAWPGLAAACVALCAAGDGLVQFTRADSAFFVFKIAVEQWLDVAILCASISSALVLSRPRRL